MGPDCLDVGAKRPSQGQRHLPTATPRPIGDDDPLTTWALSRVRGGTAMHADFDRVIFPWPTRSDRFSQQHPEDIEVGKPVWYYFPEHPQESYRLFWIEKGERREAEVKIVATAGIAVVHKSAVRMRKG